MNLLNNVFPNGNLLIMAMFFVAIMFGGGMGLKLQRTKMKSGITILMLAATVVSFVGYQATIILTEADQPLVASEAPMSSEDRYNAILADAKHGPSNYGDDWYPYKH